MTHHDSTRTQKLHSIRRRLALGVAIPSLLVFSFSSQAQASSFSTFTKTASTNKDLGKGKVRSPSTSKSRAMVAKPSSGIRSSVFKKPNKIEERVSRSKSIGLPGMQSKKEGSSSSLNRSSSNLRPGTTVGDSVRGGIKRVVPSNPRVRSVVPESKRADTGLGGIVRKGGMGIGRPTMKHAHPDQRGSRLNTPGLPAPERRFQTRLPAQVANPPLDLSKRIPRKPGSDVSKLLPGRSEGSSNIVKPSNVPSILEGNRKFDNILSSISKLKPKPLNSKDLVKELPKLTLPTENKPQLNMNRQQIVMGARNTMMQRFGVNAGCSWWADLLCGWHWHRHRCHWTDLCAAPGYWSCWRPCHYRVVWCPPMHGHVRSAWYFGIESFLIPDMHALGVHEVSPYSPAAIAGLQPGDMILSVNGYAFDNESVLLEMIQTSGGLLNLEVYREGLETPMIVQVHLRRLRITSY